MLLREIIQESLTGSLPYKWKNRSSQHWLAFFKAGQTKYAITIDSDNHFIDPQTQTTNRWYSLSFGLADNSFAGTDEPLGTHGMQFKIFSTALSGFQEFIETEKPERFIIAASKGENNRFRLYQRLAARFENALSALGYHRCDAPSHDLADIHAHADIMAWRRTNAINESVQSFKGCWILPDGEIIYCDHENDLHHADIALDNLYVEPDDDGEYDEKSSQAALEAAIDENWMRVSAIDTMAFTVNWDRAATSQQRKALDTILPSAQTGRYDRFYIQHGSLFRSYDDYYSFEKALRLQLRIT